MRGYARHDDDPGVDHRSPFRGRCGRARRDLDEGALLAAQSRRTSSPGAELLVEAALRRLVVVLVEVVVLVVEIDQLVVEVVILGVSVFLILVQLVVLVELVVVEVVLIVEIDVVIEIVVLVILFVVFDIVVQIVVIAAGDSENCDDSNCGNMDRIS